MPFWWTALSALEATSETVEERLEAKGKAAAGAHPHPHPHRSHSKRGSDGSGESSSSSSSSSSGGSSDGGPVSSVRARSVDDFDEDDEVAPLSSTDAAIETASTVVDMARKSFLLGSTAVSFVSALYLVRRSQTVQIMAMRFKLGKWKLLRDNVQGLSAGLRDRRRLLQVKVQRDSELKVLEHHFQMAKASLAFVTGPEGSGKSWVVSRALVPLDFVLRVDLHREQISTGAQLLENIVRRSGYYHPTNVLADLGIVTPAREVKGSIERKEVELAFYCLEKAMEEIVRETGKLPAIFIDELHSLKENALRSSEFTRFLQWAMHISDKGFCNIVFVGRSRALQLLDQEHESFRQRRVHFPIDYPLIKPELVKVALRHADDGKVFDGSEEAKLLVATFGGQLRDMEKAIDTADTGLSIKATVSRMVNETAHFIQASTLEPILEDIDRARGAPDGSAGTDGRRRSLVECYKRYLRCWDMLNIFSEKETAVTIVLDRLLYEVFEESGHEIDEYVDKGILRYCWPPLGSDKSHEITLTPLTPCYQRAFKLLVQKDGLKKVAMDIKRELAKVTLAEDQKTLSTRVNMLLSIQRVLGQDAPEAQQLTKDMGDIYAKLRANWADYDALKSVK